MVILQGQGKYSVGMPYSPFADVYDGMVSERPYRKVLSPSDAIKEIEQCKGTNLILSYWTFLFKPSKMCWGKFEISVDKEEYLG